MNGIIKTKTEKGFGFIRPEGGEKDVFFHESSVVAPLTFGELNVDDQVTFDVEDSPKGPRAANVTRA